MNAAQQLAKRLREVILDGKWIANTNYKDQLSDVQWERATIKVGSLNTIAALTYHINYYQAGILNVFEGGALEIRDKYSFDAPPIKSQNDWEQLRSELLTNAEQLAAHIDKMPVDKLHEGFVDPKYGTYQRNLEGIIEHSYYHLGQISLIKKMLLEADEKSF